MFASLIVVPSLSSGLPLILSFIDAAGLPRALSSFRFKSKVEVFTILKFVSFPTLNGLIGLDGDVD